MEILPVFLEIQFQSTPPHGGRPGMWQHIQISEESFNPRPRTEGDPRNQ